MATAVQIQNCKKILYEEIGQDDVFDEFFELIMKKIKPFELWKDPEIVAFARQKNIPIDDLLSPTLEEAFRSGIRYSTWSELGRDVGRALKNFKEIYGTFPEESLE